MTTLAADAHVHSEWSWDFGSDPASQGSMARTCERAVRIGLPAIVFTEHLDFANDWRVGDGDIGEYAQKYVDGTGHVRLPPFDAEGYLAAIDRCRHAYPDLRILSGVEFGQPHLWDPRAADLLSSGAIDRVNGSLHMVPFDNGDRTEPTTLYRSRSADEVMWAYLEEIPRMVAGSDSFEVFTHIDYAVRSWPVASAGPFDPMRFEDGFRAAMRAIACVGPGAGNEYSAALALGSSVVGGEGGRAVSFGSDSHGPDALASNFPEAMAMVESFGFGPGPRCEDFWTR